MIALCFILSFLPFVVLEIQYYKSFSNHNLSLTCEYSGCIYLAEMRLFLSIFYLITMLYLIVIVLKLLLYGNSLVLGTHSTGAAFPGLGRPEQSHRT